MQTFAATEASSTISASSQLSDMSTNMSSIGSMLGGLVFVILLIFLLAYLAKRFKLVTANQGQIKVIAATSLGAKEKVVLISHRDKEYLLGVTAQQITLVDKYENIETLKQTFSESLEDAKENQ